MDCYPNTGSNRIGIRFDLTLFKKENSWPFEKLYQKYEKVVTPKETTAADRAKNRLDRGIVFVPENRHIRFSQYCVNCLKPSTLTKTWEGSASKSNTEFLQRRTITTTYTRTITGIPYCRECADLSNRTMKTIRWVWLASFLLGILVWIIATSQFTLKML
jgi:hypothetical protein